MPVFRIEGDAVRRQAQNMDVTAADFRAALDRYRGAVENTYGTWYGAGSDAFKGFSGQFEATAQSLITALETMRGEVDAAGLTYDENEAEQQATVGTLNGGLGGFGRFGNGL